jgi:hypothetical protein
MNTVGTHVEAHAMNVVPIFDFQKDAPDPLEELLLESGLVDDMDEVNSSSTIRLVAKPTHFPQQSMYVLETQLKDLKYNIERLKYFLGDLDDLLPR